MFYERLYLLKGWGTALTTYTDNMHKSISLTRYSPQLYFTCTLDRSVAGVVGGNPPLLRRYLTFGHAPLTSESEYMLSSTFLMYNIMFSRVFFRCVSCGIYVMYSCLFVYYPACACAKRGFRQCVSQSCIYYVA